MTAFILFLLVMTSFGFCHGKSIKPEKVAILGGGAASCTAALALTDQPGWKERYDITIYQLGWRLGGKARSGRNKNYGQRSEEITGHHFSESWVMIKTLMKSVYKELNRRSPEALCRAVIFYVLYFIYIYFSCYIFTKVQLLWLLHSCGSSP